MTAEQAIERASRHAEECGWRFLSPVAANSYRPWLVGPLRWRVRSNQGSRGSNVRVEIDDATGRIVEAAYLPR